MDIQKLKEQVIDWAKAMGRIQMAGFQKKEVHYAQKSTAIDLVTETDLACEAYIVEQIQTHYPQHNIVSEESAPTQKQSPYTWVIDPLDGTGNFSHKYPIFCTSIALLKGEEGILGVIYVPCLEELFWAAKGEGAYLNGQKLSVRPFASWETALLATGFPYDRKTTPYHNVDYFSKIIREVRGIRRSGAAAFDLACVAAGRLSGYWEFGIQPWDMAAGRILIQEAGGCVKDIQGKRPGSIVAGEEAFCDAFLKFMDLQAEK